MYSSLHNSHKKWGSWLRASVENVTCAVTWDTIEGRIAPMGLVVGQRVWALQQLRRNEGQAKCGPRGLCRHLGAGPELQRISPGRRQTGPESPGLDALSRMVPSTAASARSGLLEPCHLQSKRPTNAAQHSRHLVIPKINNWGQQDKALSSGMLCADSFRQSLFGLGRQATGPRSDFSEKLHIHQSAIQRSNQSIP